MIKRYSSTRKAGASCTACTKLTPEDHEALHWLAVERGMSDYELTRVILVEWIRGRSADNAALPAAQDSASSG